MHQYWTIIALDALDKAREAERHRLAMLARQGRVDGPSPLRRVAARTIAWSGRGLAGLARRIDAGTAEDVATRERLVTSN